MATTPAGTGRTRQSDREGSRGDVSVRRIPALGGMDLVEARFRSWSSHRHSHPEVEVGVVVAGRRQVEYRGQHFEAPAGSILVFSPGAIHAGSPIDGWDSSYRAFLISREALEAAFEGPAHRVVLRGLASFGAPLVRDPALARRLALAHRALAGPGPGPHCTDQLAGVLIDLARLRGSTSPPDANRAPEPEAVIRVRAFLDAHYPTKIQLATLAELAGLNVFQLIRVFRAATGLPPYAYLEQLRVDRAAALLREGRPVSQVAFQTGFADQSHLTRLFKRLVGVPPGRYRLSALAACPAGAARN